MPIGQSKNQSLDSERQSSRGLLMNYHQRGFVLKIGEMLIQEGLISKAQLDEALQAQSSHPGKKLGEILIDKGILTVADFEKILLLQIEDLNIPG